MGSRDKEVNHGFICRVTISHYKKGFRLRWTIQGRRTEIYIPASIPQAKVKAHLISELIQKDIHTSRYDPTLYRYRLLIKNDMLGSLSGDQGSSRLSADAYNLDADSPVDLATNFLEYMDIKGKAEDKNYYYLTLRMLQRWGPIGVEEIPTRLSKEKIAAKTFNDRRNCLFKFFDWMIRKKKIRENPLIDVSNKRRTRRADKRKPLTSVEVTAILEALKTDRFCKKCSRYTHSQYYPFVSFLLQTGVRNGEAIGLRVKDVNFADGEICISHSFARTFSGTHASARVWKGTKTDTVRYIPLNEDLHKLLIPLCAGKVPGAFVFVNSNGNPIDDRMFLRRVFRPILAALGIDNRDLYCCRHTFATRAVQQGMKPHEVAYLMGDSVETVLQNYFHNNRKPDHLPNL